MRKKLLLPLAVVLIAASCGGGDGGATRRVFVDFSSDEFASFAFFNFPEQVVVRQGDTVDFRQIWTGEPHTVTGGSLVDAQMLAAGSWLEFFEAYEELASEGADLPNPEDPGDATVGDFATAFLEAEPVEAREKGIAAYERVRAEGSALPDLKALPDPDQPFSELAALVEEESEEDFGSFPEAFTEDGELAQNVSQPCYLEEGGPPEDVDEPCADADQRQPEFDGRHSYYNSGVIPYEGNRGNTFEVDIADDAEPGTYLFYCAIHGLGQRSTIEIRPKGADVPDQQAVARQTREETKELRADLEELHADASDLKLTIDGEDGEEVEIEGPFAGLSGAEHTGINEFFPRVIKAKVNEPITWKMMGSDHTISFDVPDYLPIMEFADDGTVRINPRIEPAAGGANPVPEEQEDEGTLSVHDGGTFDGEGFWSSGLIGTQPYLEFTMRISKPGTYPYACLIHPPMVGTVEVT